MYSKLKQLQSMREELETYQPPSGLAKWSKLFGNFRLAGSPRAIGVTRKAVLLAGFIADAQVPKELKPDARKCLKSLRCRVGFREIVWLDEKQVMDFIVQYRQNDYQDLYVKEWVENRDANPDPYDDDPPARIWKLINGKSD